MGNNIEIFEQDDSIGFTMYDLAKHYKVSVEEIQTISKEYGIGLTTEDGIVWFTKGKKDEDCDVSMFRFYYRHRDIENKVVDFLKKNQPTTLYKMASNLSLSREKVSKVLDELTFKDGNVYEKKIGGNWFLCYRRE